MKAPHDALLWRYATKKFDTAKKLTEEQVLELVNLARLSPSWYGLQPWKFILIEDPALRAKLREVSYGQPQVTDASHLLVLAHKTTLDEAYVDKVIKTGADAMNAPVEALSGLKDAVMQFTNMIQGNVSPWASNQTHIALGVLLESAAMMEIDACPMGGFDAAAYDEILGLQAEGLHAAAICALGYRSDSDDAATRPKNRFALEEVFVRK